MNQTAEEMRYGFGKNWAKFAEESVTDTAVEDSRKRLTQFLRRDRLDGLTFLDIGCGSGLHSLAAHRLGAERVISFDYDADSVATTDRLRRGAGEPANWTVLQGSVLDADFMAGLPKADVVYSWGVLHHTGDMWRAVRNAAIPLKHDGVFYIALYSADNYVDPPAEFWLKVKRAYNRTGALGKRAMEWWYAARFHFLPAIRAGQNPLNVVRNYGSRGMTFWTDARDWLGGYPMDFAGFRETLRFGRDELGLDLVNVETGEGCTEYLFCRANENPQWRAIVAQRQIVPLHGPFASQGGACYSVPLPDLKQQADCPEAPRRSRLMMYENGEMLGLAHALHEHIVRYGLGRFSHWNGDLLFSATDNSDPNANGRQYGYCETF